jgi:uncharacterized protein YbjT (DUF2867 family)
MWLAGLRDGVLRLGLPSDRRLQHTALTDLAVFAAHVMENRDEFLGRRVEVASDEVSGEEMARHISQASGREVRYEQTSFAEVSVDIETMMRWFDRCGYNVDFPSLLKEQLYWTSAASGHHLRIGNVF